MKGEHMEVCEKLIQNIKEVINQNYNMMKHSVFNLLFITLHAQYYS